MPDQDAPPPPHEEKIAARNYDFVKVKVWLQAPTAGHGGQTHVEGSSSLSSTSSHYYILSRYMLARSLQASAVSYSSATKASLLLKRQLVDQSILSLEQSTLERMLFDIILSNGLASPEELETYKMYARFQQSRTPLIILLSGENCDAKTRVAHTLSSRLHFNYVILTDALEDMMFREEKAADPKYLFRSVQNDVAKAFKDGKSIIIEGDLAHCIDDFVHGMYDEDIVPWETIAGGLVTVLQGEHLSPVLVNVPARMKPPPAADGDKQERPDEERGSVGEDHRSALIVPLILRQRGLPLLEARHLLDSGTIPAFELDEDASPEENTDEVHRWMLAAIRAVSSTR